MTRVGIYTRNKNIPATWNIINEDVIDGLKWMFINGYNSYTLYSEVVDSEYTDMSERVELNRLLYDIVNDNIDAVFVANIQILSPITIKAMQAIITIQDLGMNLYHNKGHIKADDENIKLFKTQFEENWKRINEISKGIEFGG